MRGDASIGAVAAELGIDRSGASRLVGRTIEAGYARKGTAPADGRRADLSITASGRRVLTAARRWQATTFRNLVDDWEPDDVEAFAGYLLRLSGDVHEIGEAARPVPQGAAMTIELDHTIVAVDDKHLASRFFTELVGTADVLHRGAVTTCGAVQRADGCTVGEKS